MSRPAITTSFQVGDAEGYITAGSYPDDGLGEIFMKVSKQGSTLSGVMDAFAIAVSVGLQYGVPLEDYVSKFINMKFEPSGMTNDPDIRFASSIVDYVFRRLALDHLPDGQARGARHPVDRGAHESRRRPRWTAKDAAGGRAAGAGAGADRDHGEARRRRSTTRRSATSAGRRCSRPARATSAGRAAAPAAARKLPGWTSADGRVVGLHHVQLAMPEGEEEAAVKFYGYMLGLEQVAKPPGAGAARRRLVPGAELEFHLGVEEGSGPRRRRIPRSWCEGLEHLLARLDAAGIRIVEDEVPARGVPSGVTSGIRSAIASS